MRLQLPTLLLAALLLWAATFDLGSAVAEAGPPPETPLPAGSATRVLTLESIRVEGNTRTGRDVVLARLPLEEGRVVQPDDILDAVDALRDAELFASVDFRTEPGSARGLVVLTLVVVEKNVELRFGTGYRDLDGWYLVPAELRFDNRFGRGERLRLTTKLGYRLTGVVLSFEQPHAGAGGRAFYGADIAGYGTERVYFLEGVEYAHHLGSGQVGVFAGRRLGGAWRFETGVRAETIDADSSASAYEDDELRGIEQGDDLPFAELPAGVADDVGERHGAILHAEIGRDTRATRRTAGTPVSGLWGRIRLEALLREEARATALTTDLRGYRGFRRLVLAARVRGGVVGREAAFYDRFHLGGLYTVRGFPSQSLAPAEGDTRFWSATLEVRGALMGRSDQPRVAGSVFADFGDGWSEGAPAAEDVAAAVGFGVRVRVPWIESVGVDGAVPLTESPVGESFHANAALGWNF